MKAKIHRDEYDKLMKRPPEKRVADPSGDLLYDKIAGILIAFSKRYDMRDGWLDFITIRDAEKEIRKLIKEYSQKPKLTP